MIEYKELITCFVAGILIGVVICIIQIRYMTNLLKLRNQELKAQTQLMTTYEPGQCVKCLAKHYEPCTCPPEN